MTKSEEYRCVVYDTENERFFIDNVRVTDNQIRWSNKRYAIAVAVLPKRAKAEITKNGKKVEISLKERWGDEVLVVRLIK